jgi:hypothetical protein
MTWIRRLLEQGTPRKLGRPPPIVMTSTANLIRLQSDLKAYVKGEYEFRNTPNETRIIIQRKICMNCSAKPVLTEDLRVVQNNFSITCYMCEMYIWRKAKHIRKRQTHLVRQDVT